MKSLQQLTQEIEASNEEFKKMTKAQKRVQIAKDCLERIEVEQLVPETGTLMQLNKHYPSENFKTVTQTLPSCIVCAKGGLFFSYVGRVNKFKTCDISNDNDIQGSEHTKLLELFTPNQLALIEYAFEGRQYLNGYGSIEYGEYEKQITITSEKRRNIINLFNSTVSGSTVVEGCDARLHFYNISETQRLKIILENIIENKGTFKP